MALNSQSSGLEAALASADTSEWSAAARACPAFNYRQSTPYSERLAELRHAATERWLIKAGEQIIGTANVRVKTAPILGAGLALVSAGPSLATGSEDPRMPAHLGGAVRALVREYVRRRGITLRIVLPAGAWAQRDAVGTELESSGLHCKSAGTPYRTVLVDLRPDVAALRAGLAQKWRNQLNGADRQGIDIVESSAPDAMSRFVPMYRELLDRKTFSSELGPEFYDAVQRCSDGPDRLLVVTAAKDGQDLAGAVVALGGEAATYILGATTANGMKCKAAYALHWWIMLRAKAFGATWYDLGGIDPAANPGVHHFKSGFGGMDITVPGPFEMRPSGWRGAVGRAVERGYQFAQRRAAGRRS